MVSSPQRRTRGQTICDLENRSKVTKKACKSVVIWKINANRFLETLAKARIRPKTKASRLPRRYCA